MINDKLINKQVAFLTLNSNANLTGNSTIPFNTFYSTTKKITTNQNKFIIGKGIKKY